MDQDSIFYVAFVVGFGIVVVLHGLGLCILHQVKINLFNQKVLVINLAVAEFLLSLHQVVIYSVIMSGRWNAILESMDHFMIGLSYIMIRFIVLHIILDRFADIYLNLKYPLYMDNKRTKFIVTVEWTISAILATTLTILFFYQFLSDDQIWRVTDTVIVIFDLIILVSAILTYIYFFVRVKNIKQAEDSHNAINTLRRKHLVREKFKVPIFMVLTYILFNISGQVLSTMASYEISDDDTNYLFYNISYILSIPAFSADAFIYLLLQREVRKKISLKRKRNNRVQSMESKGTALGTLSNALN